MRRLARPTGFAPGSVCVPTGLAPAEDVVGAPSSAYEGPGAPGAFAEGIVGESAVAEPGHETGASRGESGHGSDAVDAVPAPVCDEIKNAIAVPVRHEPFVQPGPADADLLPALEPAPADCRVGASTRTREEVFK